MIVIIDTFDLTGVPQTCDLTSHKTLSFWTLLKIRSNQIMSKAENCV